MANSNFIVQNGLSVGSLTIFAGNGDITTSGNIGVTGSGSFGGLNPQQIYNGTTNVTTSPTYVNVAISGSNVASFSSTAITPVANVTYNIGSQGMWFNTIYGTAQHSLYADLAENYQADAYYEPGTVVEFGGAQEITLGSADSTRVAGVVSTNPAHLMNGGLSGPNVAAVALTGRVPCKVIGPTVKGDLMVSAGWGFAKVNNNAGVGQVIGKALVDFSGAKGMIEVVIGKN
jgi:hypothetical protein